MNTCDNKPVFVISIPTLPRKKGKSTHSTDPLSPPKQTIPLKTFHFNPSPQIVDLLTDFACVHKYDDRKTFKEAWEKWITDPDIEPVIQEEIQSLVSSGYEGNALDKIFKSLKYYYVKKTKKSETAKTGASSAEKKQRKKYECLESELLTQMDVHIASQIQLHIFPNANPNTNKDSQMVKICNLSPSKSYLLFTEEHKEKFEELEEPKILQIKKTYKNRFFRMKKMLA